VSADNSLIVREHVADGFEVLEYDASSGHERRLAIKPDLTEASRFAQRYLQNNVVEYGISFDFVEPLLTETEDDVWPSILKRHD
jgi:hypothetical protein